VENAATMGEYLANELPRLAGRHACIGDVRGLGLFWGLELVRDHDSREPLVPFNASGEEAAPLARITGAALERGLYLFAHWNVLVVAPPLTISKDELEEGLAILDEVLE
jgi:taurine--2-oxoglutarate transaminase